MPVSTEEPGEKITGVLFCTITEGNRPQEEFLALLSQQGVFSEALWAQVLCCYPGGASIPSFIHCTERIRKPQAGLQRQLIMTQTALGQVDDLYDLEKVVLNQEHRRVAPFQADGYLPDQKIA